MTLSLPDAPSLEHLKNQARELLKAARAQDPQALSRLRSPSSSSLAVILVPRLPCPKRNSFSRGSTAFPVGLGSRPISTHLHLIRWSSSKTPVQVGSASRVRALLRHNPKLREQINMPLFSFGLTRRRSRQKEPCVDGRAAVKWRRHQRPQPMVGRRLRRPGQHGTRKRQSISLLVAHRSTRTQRRVWECLTD